MVWTSIWSGSTEHDLSMKQQPSEHRAYTDTCWSPMELCSSNVKSDSIRSNGHVFIVTGFCTSWYPMQEMKPRPLQAPVTSWHLPMVVPSSPMMLFMELMICCTTGGDMESAYRALCE